MQICEEARFLLRLGGLLASVMYLFSAILLYIDGALSWAMYCSRVSQGAREVAPGLFLVCLIGAILFDIAGKKDRT